METELHWAILKVFAEALKTPKDLRGSSYEFDSPLHVSVDERFELIDEHVKHTLPGYDRYQWAQAEDAAKRYSDETDKVIDDFIQVMEGAFEKVEAEVVDYVRDLALTALANR